MRTLKLIALFFILLPLGIPACTVALGQSLDAMKQADRDFSKLSDAKGPEQAFLTFLSSDVLMVNPGEAIAQGHDEIRAEFKGYPADAKLLWEPTEGAASHAGDLGYTIGTWTSSRKNPDGTTRSRNGKYFTVWQSKSGKLLGVMDMGEPQPVATGGFGAKLNRAETKKFRSAAGDVEISIGNFTTKRDGKDYNGHYVSVWKKNASGGKELLADMFNAGPDPNSKP